MTKQYRPWNPDESYLLPPSPREWLPKGHLVFFVLDVIDHVDLSVIETAIQAKDSRGVQPYDPRMMVALVVYGYCGGIVSSRRLVRAAHEDVAFRVLTASQQPDHTRISTFRRRHLKALEGLFVQVLRMCEEAGLVKLGKVALDGTKREANASKHKAMSYERMKKGEAELATEVAGLMKQAEDADCAEDEKYGKDRRGDELPEELARHGVTNQSPDAEHLIGMLDRIEQHCGARPETGLADTGYWSEENLAECKRRGMEMLIPPSRIRHGAQSAAADDAPTGNATKDAMRETLRTPAGRAAYARRKAIVEPVFGQIKQARGLRRFLLRGIESVRAEWAFICATHNLLKLFRHWLAGRHAQQTPAWLPAKAGAT